jgi:hypothetical protein
LENDMAVLVLDRKKKPLMPCSEKRARLLLARRRAVVVRVYPFTLRLKDRAGGVVQKVILKIDPGSKETGLAVSRVSAQGEHVLCLIELIHRGRQISKALGQRSVFAPWRRYRQSVKSWCGLTCNRWRIPKSAALSISKAPC